MWPKQMVWLKSKLLKIGDVVTKCSLECLPLIVDSVDIYG